MSLPEIRIGFHFTSFGMLLFFISSTITEERESWNHCMAFARCAHYLLFMIENLKQEIQNSKRVFWNEMGPRQPAAID